MKLLAAITDKAIASAGGADRIRGDDRIGGADRIDAPRQVRRRVGIRSAVSAPATSISASARRLDSDGVNQV
jgi:hypothetical protein